MTKDEALKLALEALEVSTDWDVNATGRQLKSMQAITALRKALAAHVQEPVAWGMQNDYGQIYDCITPEEHANLEGEYTVPLYTTTPVAERQWVGLTDEEVYPLANEHLHYQMEGYEVSGIYNLAQAIETKLKEKNT